MKRLTILTLLFLASACLIAQQVQTIRGHGVERESKTLLPGTNVILPDEERRP